MIAKVISIAKVFSLVNELRIIKKSNLLKISTSLYGWYYDIKIDLGVYNRLKMRNRRIGISLCICIN
jgi:hypothetical protein